MNKENSNKEEIEYYLKRIKNTINGMEIDNKLEFKKCFKKEIELLDRYTEKIKQLV